MAPMPSVLDYIANGNSLFALFFFLQSIRDVYNRKMLFLKS